MRLVLLVGLLASLASALPLEDTRQEDEVVDIHMDVEDDADLKQLLQGLFLGEQRTGRDLEAGDAAAAPAAAAAANPALNTEILLEKEDDATPAADAAKEDESDDANEIANAVKEADPAEIARFNNYMDAIFRRMNAALRAKLMDPMVLNLKKESKNEDVDDDLEEEDKKAKKGGKKGGKKKHSIVERSADDEDGDYVEEGDEDDGEEEEHRMEKREAEDVDTDDEKQEEGEDRKMKDGKKKKGGKGKGKKNKNKKDKKKEKDGQEDSDDKKAKKAERQRKKAKKEKAEAREEKAMVGKEEELTRERRNKNSEKADKKHHNKGGHNNKKARQQPEKSAGKAMGSLSGIATLRREGDVEVLIADSHKVVTAAFSVGPLQLEVSKTAGRGKSRTTRSAMATTDVMKGKMTLKVKPDGSAHVKKVIFQKPDQVDVKGSLTEQKKRSDVYVKNSVNKIRPFAAQRILKMARYVLKTPTVQRS